MDSFLDKAKEMAQDPAMQERLKSEAQKRFGGGGSPTAEHANSEGGDRSSEGAQDSGTYGGTGVGDTMPSDQYTSEGSTDGTEEDDQRANSEDASTPRY
jgi:hypothetical protein